MPGAIEPYVFFNPETSKWYFKKYAIQLSYPPPEYRTKTEAINYKYKFIHMRNINKINQEIKNIRL